MTQKISERIKKTVRGTRQDIDRRLLNFTNGSVAGFKNKVKKHTSVDLDKVDLNSELARNVAIRVLEKAQGIRKNITKDELIKAAKKTMKAKVKAKASSKTKTKPKKTKK